ncbi:unnamed protein product [Absidia cylindrospora]
MQNFPEDRAPFIMEVNKHTDYRVVFGKPLPKNTNTTHPSLVTLAQINELDNNPSLSSSQQNQHGRRVLKQYTPYTNANETWKALEMLIGGINMSAYEVSTQGRVRRRQDQFVLPLFLCSKTGQVYCDLGSASSRRIAVDTLVCSLFCMDTLKNQDKLNVVVYHRDGNRLNNHADNLEFMLKTTYDKKIQETLPYDHTVVLDGRLYHHFGARLSYLVERESARRI